MLQIYTHEKGFFVYQCRYCEEEFSSLGKFEWHCYGDDQAGHRSRLLRSIEDEARQGINKVNAELQEDINNIIKSKENAEYRARLAKQRAEEARLKKDLPYVQK